MSSLELHAVAKDFAGVHAVVGVSLDVGPGEIVGLVGPNGSGKTTVVNLCSGTVKPSSGRVLLGGRDVTGRGMAAFAAAGVVRTFQGLRLFEGLTVLENVLVGAQRGVRPSLAAALSRTPRFRARERRLVAISMEALEEVGLASRAAEPVAALSHGQRRRVELARAFASTPAFLILDEPGAGVDPDQLETLVGLIAARRDAGVGVLLVEHDLGLVDRLADRVVGMDAGNVVARGGLADVVSHPSLAGVLSAETREL